MLATLAPDFENFDGDEMLLLILSAGVCVFALIYWAVALRPVCKLGCRPFHRTPIYFGMLSGFVFLAWVVGQWADQQIRDNSGYVLLVFLMGGACLAISAALLPWLGISLREDALVQRNFAAVIALSGALAGVVITYSFANVGDGPSFWNNVFSSLLATGSLLLVFLIVAAAGGAAASITEERDLASGVRFAGFLIAEALILGRAVAGDWESMDATTKDFLRDGWPALLLSVAAVVGERVLKPSLHHPRPAVATHGWAPAIAYLLAAILWCAWLGGWGGGAG